MITSVDEYLEIGCGRCPLVGTPECKVNTWQNELVALRDILQKSPLAEELKWSNPCYTFEGKNILMLSSLKNFALLGFFKGVLLRDPHKLLESPGENSQSSRRLIYTDVETIRDQESLILEYINEAIEIEKSGKTVAFKKQPEPIPDELNSVFETNPELKTAFEALTPGRQRGYILHFSQPKQAKTRFSRIEKYTSKILAGKGFQDR